MIIGLDILQLTHLVSVPALAYTSPEHAINQDLAIYRNFFLYVLSVYIDLNRGPGVSCLVSHALSTCIRGTHVWSPRFTGVESPWRENRLYHCVQL